MTSAADQPVEKSPPAPAEKPPRVYTFRGEGTGTWQRFSWWLGRFLSRLISSLLFKFHASGKNNIPKTGGVLMVTNHQSFLDPWLIGIAPARQIHYMARDTLFKKGFLGYLLELWNSFPVKRGTADLTAIRTAVERIDKGFIVNIFPEGTRSEDGTIGNIAPGFSLILNRCKTDPVIIPVIIDGAFATWPRKSKYPRPFGPTPIHIRHGKPIPATEWRALSPEDLAVRIRTDLVKLQMEMGSPHAQDSQIRLEEDLAKAATAPPKKSRRART